MAHRFSDTPPGCFTNGIPVVLAPVILAFDVVVVAFDVVVWALIILAFDVVVVAL